MSNPNPQPVDEGKKLSRQRLWQLRHPDRDIALRKQTASRARQKLREAGYGMTHEEICDTIRGYEWRNGKVADKTWWLIYEYLDWKYNNSLICNGVNL